MNMPPSKIWVGYPTQEPLELPRRIVPAGSYEGDAVHDPFCGWAAVMVAAEGPEQQRAGIDISAKTADLLKLRGEVLRTGGGAYRTDHSLTSGMTRPSYPPTKPGRMPCSVGRGDAAPDAPRPSRSAAWRWITSCRAQGATPTQPTTYNCCATPATWPQGRRYKPDSWPSPDKRGCSSDTIRKSDYARQTSGQDRCVANRADNQATAV